MNDAPKPRDDDAPVTGRFKEGQSKHDWRRDEAAEDDAHEQAEGKFDQVVPPPKNEDEDGKGWF